MFNFFRKRTAKEFVEEAKETYLQPEKKKDPISYYRLGLTNDNRVSLQIGYGEILMNKAGVENLITQMKLFADGLYEQDKKDEEDE